MKHTMRVFSIALLVSSLCLSVLANSQNRSEQTGKYVADYVVVGGGTAGCVIARLLSDNFSNSVMMLERGENTLNDPIINACSFANLPVIFVNPKYSNSFFALNAAFGSMVIGNGTMLGGSLTHNNFLAVRGDQVYNEWASISGDSRWLLSNILPLEKANERYVPTGTIPSPSRGLTGPLVITQNSPFSGPAVALANSVATALGAPVVDDYNSNDLATSVSQQFCVTVNGTPQRTDTARAYLTPGIINPDGTPVGNRHLTVKLGATATRILFKGTRAIGVEYVQKTSNGNEKRYCVRARKQIIISSGSIYSPQLLMLSGVGPKAVLQENNIPEIFVNEHVGAHLSIQYGVAAIFNGIFRGGAPISFTNTTVPQPLNASRDSQFLFLPGAGVGGEESGVNTCIATFAGTAGGPRSTVIAWNLFPRSKGTLVLATANPFTNPFINFNSYSDGDLTDPNSDASRVVRYFKLIRDAVHGVGQTMVYPSEADFGAGDEKL
ncbi:GMC family oxidoreductase N-terminal domain-containing protein, partial [Candidatus Dependentiae bacterium]|nr:GMC family oxidoreductase N-terminal domain-containing protein [Candidatus Dependentiae bacterium]